MRARAGDSFMNRYLLELQEADGHVMAEVLYFNARGAGTSRRRRPSTLLRPNHRLVWPRMACPDRRACYYLHPNYLQGLSPQTRRWDRSRAIVPTKERFAVRSRTRSSRTAVLRESRPLPAGIVLDRELLVAKSRVTSVRLHANVNQLLPAIGCTRPSLGSTFGAGCSTVPDRREVSWSRRWARPPHDDAFLIYMPSGSAGRGRSRHPRPSCGHPLPGRRPSGG